MLSAEVQSSVDNQVLVEKRRKQVVTAAAKLFAHQGYHATTIKAITERAGISTGLIYLYVKTKEDILFLVIESLLDEYLTSIPKVLENVQDPIQRFCAAVRAYCNIVGSNPHATRLAYRETASLNKPHKKVIMEMELATNQLIIDCVQECVDRGYFLPVNVELAVYRIVLLAHGWALKTWRFNQITTLDEYIDEGLEASLRGQLTDAGRQHYEKAGGRPRVA